MPRMWSEAAIEVSPPRSLAAISYWAPKTGRSESGPIPASRSRPGESPLPARTCQILVGDFGGQSRHSSLRKQRLPPTYTGLISRGSQTKTKNLKGKRQLHGFKPQRMLRRQFRRRGLRMQHDHRCCAGVFACVVMVEVEFQHLFQVGQTVAAVAF